MTHAVIRELLLTSPIVTRGVRDAELVPSRPGTLRGVPINQEDLLGALGTFTVTTFEVMEKLGVPWNDEAELAYLMLWIGSASCWASARGPSGRAAQTLRKVGIEGHCVPNRSSRPGRSRT